MKRLVLGVSGSVAAYRAADLARELMRHDYEVRVCLTDAASEFVRPALFEALTGQPCLQDTFEEPERGRMAHIDWARSADVLLIAPATANTLTKLAHGYGDDMLTTLALAFTGPLVIAPAMNPSMYASESVQLALRLLEARTASIVEPESGDVACGENGQGKFAAIDRIVDVVESMVGMTRLLQGKQVLITSGPTREPIDSVRFLSNRSSGKMGAAIARVALMMGAEVTIVSGPVSVQYPIGARVISVQTALEMLSASLAEAGRQDWIIGVAAVADYRPAHPASGKIRRSDAPAALDLEPNPDVIAALAKAAPQARVVGFAAEPSPELVTARSKMSQKGLFAIAANDISKPNIGFESDHNEISLIINDMTKTHIISGSKHQCARQFWQLLTSAQI